MAKASNGLGKFSGKLGGAVFVIRNGKQIVREYNPRPTNPKSALQMIQRAKGNIAGRITSVTPKAAIFGLGVNASARRSRFNKLLLDNAEVNVVNDNYNAKVPLQDIVFSEGTVVSPFIFGSSVAAQFSLSLNFIGVNASTVPPADYATYGARVVVMVYDLKSQDLVEVATRLINKPNQGDTLTTQVAITHPMGYTAAFFLVPMRTNDGTAMSVSTDVAMKDDMQVAASLSVNGSAVVFEYGRSVFIGQDTFTPSATSAAPSKEGKKE